MKLKLLPRETGRPVDELYRETKVIKSRNFLFGNLSAAPRLLKSIE